MPKRYIYSIAAIIPGEKPGQIIVSSKPGMLQTDDGEEHAQDMAWGAAMRTYPTSKGYAGHTITLWCEDNWPEWMKEPGVLP